MKKTLVWMAAAIVSCGLAFTACAVTTICALKTILPILKSLIDILILNWGNQQLHDQS